MPRGQTHGGAEEPDDRPELPGMLGRESLEQDGTGNESTVERSPGSVQGKAGLLASSFAQMREQLLDMRGDTDLSPSMAGYDDGYIPLGKMPTAYVTIHPDPAYELVGAMTHDFRKSNAKSDPYLVMRPQWRLFPPGLLRVKRLILCQSYIDGLAHNFIWVADWFEASESPGEFHKSINRVIVGARQGWGQVLYNPAQQLYTWGRWNEEWGPQPLIVWPERDFIDILLETLAGRIIDQDDHELIRAIARGATHARHPR